MANKITVLLDLVTDKATSAAKGFKASIADAEGSVNKFKAGASSAFATVQANAGALALGAGSALAAFGAKSIATFQDTALAAGKFSDATGIAVEDASRLQEVAGDLGVNTDALAGSLARFQKAVASNSSAVQDLGIQVQHTKDGTVDVNATFLEAIAKLGTVTDANKKAQLAAQLFGKGFADSAELILGNADDIKQRLADVSKAQVISDKQVAQARKFRDQMDDLQDSLKQVEIVVGNAVVPVVGDLADALLQVQSAAVKAKNAIEEIPGGKGVLDQLFTTGGEVPGQFLKHLRDLEEGLGFTVPAANDVGKLREEFNKMVAAGNAANDVVDKQGNLVGDLGDRWSAASIPLEAASGAFAEMSSHADDLARATKDSGDAAKDAASDWNVFEDGLRKSADTVDFVTGKINELRGVIDLGGELDDLAQGFDDIIQAQKDLADADNTKDRTEASRKLRDEIRRQQGNLLDLLETYKQIPAEKRTQIIAEIAAGDLDSLNKALDDIIGKDRFVHVGLIMPNVQQAFSGVNVTVAPGGVSNSPTFLNQNPAPVNNSQTTIIYPVGSSPTTQFIDQRLYQTRNGTNPR